MGWLHKLSMQARMLFRRGEQDARLNDELQFHIDQQIAENMAAGMSADEARHAAMSAFGNPTALRDQTRDAWSWNWLEKLWRDLRYGTRTLGRAPGFSIVAILVMALGIGANVALLTVVRSVLLKPLPFKDPDRLVRLFEADAQGRFEDNIVAGGTFGDWKKQARSFDDMAATKLVNYNLSGTSGQFPEIAEAYVTSWNLFTMLGVQPALGRSFLASDDRPDANAVVMLSWGLWKRRYGGESRHTRQKYFARCQVLFGRRHSSRMVHVSGCKSSALDPVVPREAAESNGDAYRAQLQRGSATEAGSYNPAGNC